MGKDHYVKKYLPERYWKVAEKYTISDGFLEDDSDLVVLILDSRSLDSPEDKQSWFDMYPEMTPDQKKGLNNILVREKEQLAAIEEQFPENEEE